MAGCSDSPGCSPDSPVSDERAGDHGDSHKNGNNDSSGVREQDRFLPIANISRIMKRALPANAKIAKEAKDIIQECVSEFVSFITSEASDKCQREKRKTINGDDLLWALGTLGFEDYVEPLKIYLSKFRELEGDGKGTGPTSKNGIETLTRKEASGSTGLSNVQVGQPVGYHTTMGYCQPQTQQTLATTHENWTL